MGRPLDRSTRVGGTGTGSAVSAVLTAPLPPMRLLLSVPSSPSSRKRLLTVSVPMSSTRMSDVLELCGTSMTGAPASMSRVIRDPLNACSAIYIQGHEVMITALQSASNGTKMWTCKLFLDQIWQSLHLTMFLLPVNKKQRSKLYNQQLHLSFFHIFCGIGNTEDCSLYPVKKKLFDGFRLSDTKHLFSSQ